MGWLARRVVVLGRRVLDVDLYNRKFNDFLDNLEVKGVFMFSNYISVLVNCIYVHSL